MAMSPKLVMRQGQSLVMTPQLSQSIKLLAMSNIELSTFVEGELERNPFLERDGQPDGEAQENRQPGKETVDNTPSDSAVELNGSDELEISAQAMSENLGTNLENVFPDEVKPAADQVEPKKAADVTDTYVSSSGISVSNDTSAYDRTVADFAASSISLRDHLHGQLAISAGTSTTINIAKDIIENLDEAGYLQTDLQAIADRMGVGADQVEKALEVVQGLEPVGVAARSLAECLRLQLNDRNRLDPAMVTILDNLDCLARRDFETLRKITGLDLEDLHDALVEIQLLDPKPGTAFENSPLQHVAPDVIVQEGPDGAWRLELNSDTLPRVLVNNTYLADVSGKLINDQDSGFLSECMQSASWLTKSLDQRAHTILKVASEIVKQQDAFLAYGVQHLKPLTLRAVADAIDMHESSVSRVTNNKYMMTPRGMFELKYFFTSSISATEGGESHSSEAVRARIKMLVDAETVRSVLSDDAIVTALKAHGVEIARRTVAKYRESMNIQSSVQRRREKRAMTAVNQTDEKSAFAPTSV